MNKLSRFDLCSIGLIIFFSVLSLIRFSYLPQFLDGYYHLSVANAFIKAGGWTGWSFWEFAPQGRPHLYPPLYHFIIVFLIKAGISGLNCIRLTEVLIVPVFLLVAWRVLRNLANDIFSFAVLVSLASFFPFYASISANVPASIAIIFGFLTWFFIKRYKFITASLLLALSFYTHAAIPWVFFISIFFLGIFLPSHRKISFSVLLSALVLALPIIYRQAYYWGYLNISKSAEFYVSHISIFITVAGLLCFFIYGFKKEYSTILFSGYFIAAATIFIKYPYRLFSSQGLIGPVFFVSIFLHRLFSSKIKMYKILAAVVVIYLFFIHSAIQMREGRPEFKPAHSTVYNFIRGDVFSVFQYQPLIYPKKYGDIIKIIKANTDPNDILLSNYSVVAQMFSALTGRFSALYIMPEVRPLSVSDNRRYSKILVCAGLNGDCDAFTNDNNWKKLAESSIFHIFLNNNAAVCNANIKVRFKFIWLLATVLIITAAFVVDNRHCSCK